MTDEAAAWAFAAVAAAAAGSGAYESLYLWRLHNRARREDGARPKAATRLLRYLAIAMTALTVAAAWYAGTTTWAVVSDARIPTPLRLVSLALAVAALAVPTYVGRGLRKLAAERAARQLALRLRNLHGQRAPNGRDADR
jgi:peptidoglycan biosynthesis protein MviN/MurJ (putative lipid II flippase)